MNKCFICGKEIYKDAVEHIIPSALGGRLIADILCKKHNSTFGDSIDIDLINCLAFYTNILNPRRGRGGNHPDLAFDSEKGTINRSATGKISHKNIEYHTDSNGNPKLSISLMGENVEKDAKKIAGNFIKKNGKKNKWNDEKISEELKKLDDVIKNKTQTIQCPELSKRIALGTDNSWLGIIKIAVEFAIINGINITYLKDKIDILLAKDIDKAKCFSGFYYPSNTFYDVSICHTIILIGNNQNGVLYCLVSLYNVWNSLIILSDNYDGQDIRKTYCYDLMNNKEINQSIKHCVLSKNTLFKTIKASTNNISKYQDHILHFLNFFSMKKHI